MNIEQLMPKVDRIYNFGLYFDKLRDKVNLCA